MKRLFAGVALVCVTTVTSVSADSLDDALGAARASLSDEQIAMRAERLEHSTTFALLRFAEAQRAPARIFSREIWSIIEAAARTHDVDPMILAGMIFIESYGDPLAKSPTGPAGIAQLTKASAKELGLSTGRRVRVGTKAVRKTRWVGKGASRRKVTQTVQQPVYKTFDERYVPERAIMAMAKRISNRRAWLGGHLDFAIAEYHMGAGRMAKLLSAYFGRQVRVSDVPAEMAGADISYAQLFFTNTPYVRPAVYQTLEALNKVDFSPTYYFRVRQAARLLQIYRTSPVEYAQLADRFQNRLGHTSIGPALHEEVDERFVVMPEIASAFGVRAVASEMTAERSTVGAALFVARQLKSLQGSSYTGFGINRMLMQGDDAEDEESLPMHGIGWAFDLSAAGLSKTDLRDLKFVLTDLRYAGLLAYVSSDDDRTFHIVRHPDHAPRFEQFYWDVMAGSIPPDQPRMAATGADARIY